jgi:putative transcriptional regulator
MIQDCRIVSAPGPVSAAHFSILAAGADKRLSLRGGGGRLSSPDGFDQPKDGAMPLLPARRACRIACILLLAAALPGVVAPAAATDAPRPGQLLIASRSMGDPRFSEAVILILHHDAGGAFGIVINRPIGERSIKSLLAATGEGKEVGVTGNLRVFAGGPVEPQLGFVIHTPDYRRKDTLTIDDEVAMTADRAILVDIGHRHGPRKSLIAFGYAGWAAGQLEAEIADHAWYIAPGDPRLIFDTPRAELWDKAMARRLHEL